MRAEFNGRGTADHLPDVHAHVCPNVSALVVRTRRGLERTAERRRERPAPPGAGRGGAEGAPAPLGPRPSPLHSIARWLSFAPRPRAHLRRRARRSRRS